MPDRREDTIQGWQPIETAPEWQSVLVFQREAPNTKSNKLSVFSAVLTERGWTLCNHGRRKGEFLEPSPTHWMPLPAPPNTSIGERDDD
jgi:hypothetical protein